MSSTLAHFRAMTRAVRRPFGARSPATRPASAAAPAATACDGGFVLHVVYRSCGTENRKGRPPYYSKLLSLTSLLQALARMRETPEIIYLNDGPIPPDRLTLMERTGEVLRKDNLGGRGSMRAALALPEERGWGAGDIVWFAEDDHLYAADAFVGLRAATLRFAEADYFGLYASIGDRGADGKPHSAFAHVPKDWRGSDPVLVEGHPWRHGLSTTSTFGARVGAIRGDRRMMETAMLSGGAWDHTTCLMYQGFGPFAWNALGAHFGPTPSLKRKARSAAIRVPMNLWQTSRRLLGARRRILVAPDPPLSTHLESDHLAPGTDWTAVAEDCLRRAGCGDAAPAVHGLPHAQARA